MPIRAAEDVGADVVYDAEARSLLTAGSRRRVTGVDALVDSEPTRYHSDAVVIAAGGFESSVEKRTRCLGPEYDDMTVRGVRYNTGHPIEVALDIGAKADGNWSGGHVSMVNAEAPDVGSGVNSFYG